MKAVGMQSKAKILVLTAASMLEILEKIVKIFVGVR